MCKPGKSNIPSNKSLRTVDTFEEESDMLQINSGRVCCKFKLYHFNNIDT